MLIAGPCVIESEAHALMMAERLVDIAAHAKVPFIFKASYDKANRSSEQSYRGPGLTEGLAHSEKNQGIVSAFPILTDIHEASQAAPAAEVADVLQIPAFLSRQTDLLIAAGKTGRVVNLKKGQFLSPWEMANAVEKVTKARETIASFSPSAALRSATRIWWWTCARFRFCARRAARWYST